MQSSAGQFRTCHVCQNQRPQSTLMLLPCCFRQATCLWCVAASVEVKHSIECTRCGGSFHGPFTSIHDRGDNKSSHAPQMNMPPNRRMSIQTRRSCSVQGCDRSALNEACSHCGTWFCAIDDLIHREDIVDKQIAVLELIIQRARQWMAAMVLSDSTEESRSPTNKSPTVIITQTPPIPPIGQLGKISSLESVNVSTNSQQNVSKNNELEMVIERGETIINILETKRIRRIDINVIFAEITEMKKKVSFLESMSSRRPNCVPIGKPSTCPPSPLQSHSKISPSPLTPTSVSSQSTSSQYVLQPSSPTSQSRNRSGSCVDRMTIPDQQLTSQIRSSVADMSSVDKLKLAIALEEERLKDRRQRLKTMASSSGSSSPLPLLLVVSEIAANDPNEKKLSFHPIHGSNIILSSDAQQASRKEPGLTSGSNVCFTHRPINDREKVVITCLESYPTSHSTEIGFTNHDPVSLTQELPHSFTNSLWGRDESSWLPGFWIYIGRGTLVRENDTLSFYYTSKSTVVITEANGRSNSHKLPKGISIDKPLWAIVALAGRPCSVSIMSTTNVTSYDSGQ